MSGERISKEYFENVRNFAVLKLKKLKRFIPASTDSACKGQQDSKRPERGPGWGAVRRERPESAGSTGPGETSGQDGADVQLEEAAAARQPSQIRRYEYQPDTHTQTDDKFSQWGSSQIAHLSINFPPVTDAYCLLDVYSTLSSDPASFGLPADLRSVSLSQAEKSRDRKQKSESETEQKKRDDHEEVRSRLCSAILMI